MSATDPLSFVWDPNGDADHPVAVRRYGAHDIRLTAAQGLELRRQLLGMTLEINANEAKDAAVDERIDALDRQPDASAYDTDWMF